MINLDMRLAIVMDLLQKDPQDYKSMTNLLKR
jgi:hypothetical protein